MNPNFYAAVALVIVLLLAPSAVAQVDVTTPGNVLALLPSAGLASSTENFVGGGIAHSVNNLVNTATVDDGLTFLDSDTNQRLAITGFNSAIRNIRLFSAPEDTRRVPPSLAIYYSKLSTTSLLSSDSNYTGTNGGVLVPMMSVSPASFDHPIAGSNAAYLDLFVNCAGRDADPSVRAGGRHRSGRPRLRSAGLCRSRANHAVPARGRTFLVSSPGRAAGWR